MAIQQDNGILSGFAGFPDSSLGKMACRYYRSTSEGLEAASQLGKAMSQELRCRMFASEP